MRATLHAFADSLAAAERLANLLGIVCVPIEARRFTDGEALVRVALTETTALLYRSLDHPDGKLIELLFAASALRDRGATRVMLVAPYLCYMRQDTAFRPGECVSQKVIGSLIAAHFDAVITVNPHLHRVESLAQVVPGIPAIAVSAAGTLAEMLRSDITTDTILIGPDVESRLWVQSVAEPLGLSVIVGEKRRLGDREVSLTIPDIERVRGRPVVLVDDLISSGVTLQQSALLLKAAGATLIEACATHCLATASDLRALREAGISRVQSTDTVDGPTASAHIAPALADALTPLFSESSPSSASRKTVSL